MVFNCTLKKMPFRSKISRETSIKPSVWDCVGVFLRENCEIDENYRIEVSRDDGVMQGDRAAGRIDTAAVAVAVGGVAHQDIGVVCHV